MYKIISTEMDDGKLLIKTKDLRLQITFLYYVDEVPYIPMPQLKRYLQKRLPFIKSGEYG